MIFQFCDVSIRSKPGVHNNMGPSRAKYDVFGLPGGYGYRYCDLVYVHGHHIVTIDFIIQLLFIKKISRDDPPGDRIVIPNVPP